MPPDHDLDERRQVLSAIVEDERREARTLGRNRFFVLGCALGLGCAAGAYGLGSSEHPLHLLFGLPTAMIAGGGSAYALARLRERPTHSVSRRLIVLLIACLVAVLAVIVSFSGLGRSRLVHMFDDTSGQREARQLWMDGLAQRAVELDACLQNKAPISISLGWESPDWLGVVDSPKSLAADDKRCLAHKASSWPLPPLGRFTAVECPFFFDGTTTTAPHAGPGADANRCVWKKTKIIRTMEP